MAGLAVAERSRTWSGSLGRADADGRSTVLHTSFEQIRLTEKIRDESRQRSMIELVRHADLSDLTAREEQGRISEALAAQRRLYPFLDALFAEEFPSAVRVTFENLGLPIGKSLPPVGELSKAALRRLERAVADLLAAGILRRFG